MRKLVLLATAASNVCLLAAPTYHIRIDRPDPVGMTYKLSAKGSRHMLASSGDRTLKSEEFRVVFTGQAKVLEVDKAGRAYKIAFTVEKFSRINSGISSDLLPAGSVIIADGSRKDQYSLSEGFLDKAAASAFSVIYSGHRPNSVSEDEMLATKTARFVGESWPVDAELARKSAQEDGDFVIPPNQLSGTSCLVGIKSFAGSDCAQVESRMEVDNLGWKGAGSELVVDRGALTMQFHGCFPVKESSASSQNGQSVHLRVTGRLLNGTSVEITMDSEWDATWLASGKEP